MLNLRDVTKNEDMHDAMQMNRLMKRVFSSLAADFMGPFSSITYICEIMEESDDMIDLDMLKHNCSIMKNAAKIASLKTKTFLDLERIQNKTFTSNRVAC